MQCNGIQGLYAQLTGLILLCKDLIIRTQKINFYQSFLVVVVVVPVAV